MLTELSNDVMVLWKMDWYLTRNPFLLPPLVCSEAETRPMATITAQIDTTSGRKLKLNLKTNTTSYKTYGEFTTNPQVMPGWYVNCLR